MRKPLVLIVSVSAGIAIASSARAQCDVAQRRATGNRPDVRLGRSVSIAGDAAVFGAPGDGETARYPSYARGSARVFRRQNSTWIEEATLLASDGRGGDHFGIAVAISGDTVVVGADYARESSGVRSGAAHIYRFNGSTWLETQKLTAPNGVENTTFGHSVAISDDTVVIGAPEVGGLGVAASSVYVYRFDGATWVRQARLVPSVGRLRDFFGISVAVSGDTVLIGAMVDDDHGSGAGAAYIFHFDGADWLETAKLFADAGVLTLTSFISPYRADRDLVRKLHDEAGLTFIEVYVKAALDICEQRDPKGLYKKARAGEIPEFTGISAPYEEPLNAEIVVDTGRQSPQECAAVILNYLAEKGLVRD